MREINFKVVLAIFAFGTLACKKDNNLEPIEPQSVSLTEKVSVTRTSITYSLGQLKGDGISDNRSILQGLINSYASNKQTLILPAGKFMISDEIVLPSFTTIEGAGDNTEIILSQREGSNRKVFRVPTRITNVSIKKLKLNANQSVNTGANLAAYHVTDNTKSIYAENVTFAGGRTGGSVLVKGLNAYPIIGASFINCKFIEAGNTSLELRGCKDAVISGNIFENWGLVNPNSPSLQLQSQDNINTQIVKNTFNNKNGVQFAIESAAANVVNSNISENILNDPKNLGGNGISGYYINTTFTKNTFNGGKGTHRSGFEIFGSGNSITYNTITAGSIAVSSGKTEEGKNITIAFNNVKTKGSNVGGIQLGGGGFNLNGVKILSNTVDTRASSGNSSAIVLGIYNGLRAVLNITIEANTIYTNAHGIRMQSLPGSRDIFINKNVFKAGYTWIGVITNTFSNVVPKGNIIEHANKQISYSSPSIQRITSQ